MLTRLPKNCFKHVFKSEIMLSRIKTGQKTTKYRNIKVKNKLYLFIRVFGACQKLRLYRILSRILEKEKKRKENIRG